MAGRGKGLLTQGSSSVVPERDHRPTASYRRQRQAQAHAGVSNLPTDDLYVTPEVWQDEEAEAQIANEVEGNMFDYINNQTTQADDDLEIPVQIPEEEEEVLRLEAVEPVGPVMAVMSVVAMEVVVHKASSS
ncbi:hypothetical protein ABFS83_08G109100 [Erythranthe nasuta]